MLKAQAQALALGANRPGVLVARVGGEEFAVLLPDTDAEGAACVAEAVHDAIAALVVAAEGVGVGPITVSISLAFGLPGRDGSPAGLLRLADAALYEAKAAGRNRTCFAVMGLGQQRPSKSTSSKLWLVGAAAWVQAGRAGSEVPGTDGD